MQKSNNLTVTHPHIAEQWHPTLNGELKPTDVTYGSNKKVSWLCSKNPTHEWDAVISNRTKGKGCPHCNKERQTSFPEQAIYFYIKQVFPDTVNRFCFDDSKLELDIYIPQYNIGIEYDGGYYHQDKMRDEIKSLFMIERCTFIRIREHRCPNLTTGEMMIGVDSNDNSLEQAIDELFHFIEHVTKKTLSYDINIQRDKIEIYHLMKMNKKEKSLQNIYPDIAKQWHPTLNGELQPTDVTYGSNKQVYWRCNQNLEHKWEASVKQRTKGTGCPYCAGKKVCADNNLTVTHPHIAKEWHPTLNGELKATDVTYGSTKKVWWQCIQNQTHIWPTQVYHRTTGRACPTCCKLKRDLCVL